MTTTVQRLTIRAGIVGVTLALLASLLTIPPSERDTAPTALAALSTLSDGAGLGVDSADAAKQKWTWKGPKIYYNKGETATMSIMGAAALSNYLGWVAGSLSASWLYNLRQQDRCLGIWPGRPAAFALFTHGGKYCT